MAGTHCPRTGCGTARPCTDPGTWTFANLFPSTHSGSTGRPASASAGPNTTVPGRRFASVRAFFETARRHVLNVPTKEKNIRRKSRVQRFDFLLKINSKNFALDRLADFHRIIWTVFTGSFGRFSLDRLDVNPLIGRFYRFSLRDSLPAVFTPDEQILLTLRRGLLRRRRACYLCK